MIEISIQSELLALKDKIHSLEKRQIELEELGKKTLALMVELHEEVERLLNE